MAEINGKCPFCQKQLVLDTTNQATLCPHCNTPFVTQSAVEKACETDLQAMLNHQREWDIIQKEIDTYNKLMSIGDYDSAHTTMIQLSSRFPTKGVSYLVKAHFYICTTHSVKNDLFIRTNYPSLATSSELDEIERKLAIKQVGVHVPGTCATKEYFESGQGARGWLFEKIDSGSKLFEYWGDLKVVYEDFNRAQLLMTDLEKNALADKISQLKAYFERVDKLADVAMRNDVEMFRKAKDHQTGQAQQQPTAPVKKKRSACRAIIPLAGLVAAAILVYIIIKQFT